MSFDQFPADRFRLQFLRYALKVANDVLAASRSCEIRSRIHALSAPLCRVVHRQITGDSVYLVGPKESLLKALQGVFITGKNLRAMDRFRPPQFQEQILKIVEDLLAVPHQAIACTGCGHAAMGNCARNEYGHDGGAVRPLHREIGRRFCLHLTRRWEGNWYSACHPDGCRRTARRHAALLEVNSMLVPGFPGDKACLRCGVEGGLSAVRTHA